MKINWLGILLSIVISLLCYFFVPAIYRSYSKINRINRRMIDIDAQILAYKEGIKSYDDKLEKLNIEFYREKIAREKLQMVREGEKLYKLAN